MTAPATSPTITAAAPAWPAADWNALRAAGLAYVEQYAHDLWTDYNRHDPGVTILELLCYAITDLSQRTSLDMKDLLRSAYAEPDQLAASFLTARQALPTSPVTARDYRKLLMDVKGVRNAWLVPRRPVVKVHPSQTARDQRLVYAQNEGTPDPHGREFSLRGLYDIMVELEPNSSTPASLVLYNVRRKYLCHRNLAEDVVDVRVVDQQPLMFCADVELAPGAKARETYLRILQAVENHLNPPVPRYTLAQMRALRDENDQPLGMDRIFEGPALKHGFIRDEDLAASPLRPAVHASDLIGLMMNIPGVVSVRKLRLNTLRKKQAAQLGPADGAEQWEIDGNARGQQWTLPIPAGHQPVLVPAMTSISFYRDIVPVSVNRAEVLELLEAARAQAPEWPGAEDLPVPLGTAYDVGAYSSLVHDFPANYGVGAAGLPASASEERRRQALQLKGYLLFFDQLLSNYLAQLVGVSRLFDPSDVTPTSYFGRVLREEDFPGLDELLLPPPPPPTDLPGMPPLSGRLGLSIPLTPAQRRQQQLDDLLAALEDSARNPVRKQRFLDHLLARFAESFSEYAMVMHSVLASRDEPEMLRGEQEILADKAALLADYANFRPAQGFDYGKPAWRTENLAGITRRFGRLAGLTDFRAQEPNPRIGADPVFVVEHLLLRPNLPDAQSQDGGELRTPPAATLGAKTAKTSDNGGVVGLVPDHWLEVCLEPDGSFCEPLDPYSYRVSIVLPGYGNFANVDYRRYAEKMLRSELPAHVLARICWVSESALKTFARLYHNWLDAKLRTQTSRYEVSYTGPLATALDALITGLDELHTIYPAGVLHDCDNDEEEQPIVLGRTTIGELPPDHDMQPDVPTDES